MEYGNYDENQLMSYIQAQGIYRRSTQRKDLNFSLLSIFFFLILIAMVFFFYPGLHSLLIFFLSSFIFVFPVFYFFLLLFNSFFCHFFYLSYWFYILFLLYFSLYLHFLSVFYLFFSTFLLPFIIFPSFECISRFETWLTIARVDDITNNSNSIFVILLFTDFHISARWWWTIFSHKNPSWV